jgi:hypothetical protein
MNRPPSPRALPPLTEQPVRLADITVGAHLISVWADRPARELTKILLADEHGHACGDATLHGETLTITLPGTWNAADKVAVTTMIARLTHQSLPDS